MYQELRMGNGDEPCGLPDKMAWGICPRQGRECYYLLRGEGRMRRVIRICHADELSTTAPVGVVIVCADAGSPERIRRAEGLRLQEDGQNFRITRWHGDD